MLTVSSLSFGYESETVLEDISFRLDPGELIAVMGESGCGKSTLLKLIYGELPFEQGSIQWKDHPIKGPAYQLLPGAPFMKYLAQDFDLMPFISVEENIAKFLSVHYPEETARRTEELLDSMELAPYRSKQVRFLSGGQQQRVALARVLAQKPELLLLDEPFGHIDHFRRNKLRRNLFEYLKREGISCLCATHDYNDVLPFADRVMVLREKGILDLRPTQEIYEQPARLYTAYLLGEANLIPIDVLKSYAQTTRKIIVYAHELRVSHKSGLEVDVQLSYYMGSYYRVYGKMEGEKGVYFNSEKPLAAGEKVFLNVSLETINKRLPI
ncbi:ABC transporter ATP-binding protein [Robiginitalea sp. SC105]|uniref:ABC transporter ATP-binding protein n=1 Tax=Robiginitalea sp. SC105 TaxID=2762332 RepID=UPI001639FAD4|nr:ABC transporter ATP-binding protein [Robiginitalea sp. SC105]MBC2838094.1 ABC transporter ATP-binding protein [Robiginitalea sp. SC105]